MDGMRHFPLKSTRSECLFAFSASVLSLFLWGRGGGGGGGKSSGRDVSRSGKHGRQPVVLFVCVLVRQEDTSVVIYMQSLYYLFDISAFVQCSI